MRPDLPTLDRRPDLQPLGAARLPGGARPPRLPARPGAIVVDDGSARPPAEVVPGRLDATLVARPRGARNAGAARAAGRFLAFTDDDCAPDPGWLRALAARLAAAPDALVGGHTINVLRGNPYATASQLLVDYLYDYYNAGPDGARFFTSNNMALAAAGARRLRHHLPPRGGGGPGVVRPLAPGWGALVYAPGAIVRHAHALTPRRFWRQHLNYGRGAFHFHQTRARRGRDRVRVEPPSFYLNLLPSRGRSCRGRCP